MANDDYKIGDFEFITLTGDIPAIGERIDRKVRRGVDGASFWRLGQGSEPFTLTSGVDQASVSVARQTFKEYKALQGTDPVVLRWLALDFSLQEEVKVFVHHVRQVALHELANSTPGLNTPSLAWLACEWQLELVDVADT